MVVGVWRFDVYAEVTNSGVVSEGFVGRSVVVVENCRVGCARTSEMTSDRVLADHVSTEE